MQEQLEPSNRPPVRVALLLDSTTVTAWVERMLARIDDFPGASIVLLIVQHKRPAAATSNGQGRLAKQLLRKVETLDAPAHESAFEPRSIEDRYAQVPRIQLGEGPLTGSQAEHIREHALDVLLCLDPGAAHHDLASLARCGAWSLLSSDGRFHAGGPAGFWEVLKGQATTRGRLVMQAGPGADDVVLAETRTATHPSSVAKNRETLAWGSLSLVPRELERLNRLGSTAFLAQLEHAPAPTPLAEQDADPLDALGSPKLTACFFGLLRKRLQRSIRYRLYEEQWHLRYHFNDAPAEAFREFSHLMPPRDRYWADPMPLFHEGCWHIFFEDFPYATEQGHISVISFDESLTPQPSRQALAQPYHLSYPFVFHWDERLWMMPETASNGTVELYECVSFPDQWTLRRRILKDRYIVDATLERHGDRWYLFASEVENPGASSWTEAFVYVNEGDLLDGCWTAHPDNPIRSDVRCARPAGPLYRSGKGLFRPAQDCSKRYGGAMTVHEITELGPQSYAETIDHRIQPDWEPDLHGVHTYSHRPGLTVIDVMQEVPRSSAWARLPNWVHRRLTR